MTCFLLLAHDVLWNSMYVSQVDQTFEVRGVGCVLSGTVVSGTVKLGQQLWLGPDDLGRFKDVTVTCIQREQVQPSGSLFFSVCVLLILIR